MKILVVTPKYYPANFTVNLIVDGFVKKGNDVTVLTAMPYSQNGEHLQEYLANPVEEKERLKVVRLVTKPCKKSVISLINNYMSFYFESKKWVTRCNDKYDVVYTFGVSPVTALAAGNLYKELYGAKHVAHLLDIWPDSLITAGYSSKHSPFYLFMKMWSKRIYSKIDLALIGSPSFEKYIKEELKLNSLNIKYIPQPALVGKDLKEENPYKKENTNILYCGNISRTQLVDYIVPAMKKVEDKNIHFYIIGSGRYTDGLMKDIIDNELEDRVHYLGPIPYYENYHYFSNADAFYLGLRNKGFAGKTIPNKLISSLYYSKPIIGMISGDGADILNKTKGGIIINEDVDSLKEAIIKISKMSVEEKAQLGLNNSSYYKEHFDFKKIINELLDSFH